MTILFSLVSGIIYGLSTVQLTDYSQRRSFRRPVFTHLLGTVQHLSTGRPSLEDSW